MVRVLSTAEGALRHDSTAASSMGNFSSGRGKTRMNLLQRINGQTTQQFGIKVGGLLRHHAAGKGDFAKLRDFHRIHEECNLSLARAHRLDGFASIANI